MKKLVPLILCVLLNARLSGFDQCKAAIFGLATPVVVCAAAIGIGIFCHLRRKSIENERLHMINQLLEEDETPRRNAAYSMMSHGSSNFPALILFSCTVLIVVPAMALLGSVYCK